jgi:hypothetical protein
MFFCNFNPLGKLRTSASNGDSPSEHGTVTREMSLKVCIIANQNPLKTTTLGTITLSQ